MQLTKENKKKIDQIFNMMNYLGEKTRYSKSNLYKHSPVYMAETRKIQDEELLSEFNIIEVYNQLKNECRELALSKVIDLEMANQGLFWCMNND